MRPRRSNLRPDTNSISKPPSTSKASRTSKPSPKPTSNPSKTTSLPSSSPPFTSSTPLQRTILSAFPAAFPATLASPDLPARIQRLKQRLYARDFAAAFGEAANLEAYALRWSPVRALAYVELLTDGEVGEEMRGLFEGGGRVRQGRRKREDGKERVGEVDRIARGIGEVALDTEAATQEAPTDGSLTIAAFGAGAGAELAALAGVLCLSSPNTGSPAIHLRAIDIGPWGSVLSSLHNTLATSLPTSHDLDLSFIQHDALALSPTALASFAGGAKLVTFLFTLNELYAASKGKTTALLLALTEVLAAGARLLVVDSAGSYGTVDVGDSGKRKGEARETVEKAEGTGEKEREDQSKKYPMHWLLDHTLLEAASVGPETEAGALERPSGHAKGDVALSAGSGENGEGHGAAAARSPAPKTKRWRKLYTERARWFRRPPDLTYPLPLEDMRFQVHCYERI